MTTDNQKCEENPDIPAQPHSAMIDTERNIFSFFELPAELRIFIYDASITTVHAILASNDGSTPRGTKIAAANSNVKMTAADAVPPNLLLISRRFSQEISALTPRKKTVILASATDSKNVFARSCTIPALLSKTDHIKIITQINLSHDPFAFRTFFRNLASLLKVLRPEQEVTVHWSVERPGDCMVRKAFWTSLMKQWKSYIHRGTGTISEMYVTVHQPLYYSSNDELPASRKVGFRWIPSTGVVEDLADVEVAVKD